MPTLNFRPAASESRFSAEHNLPPDERKFVRRTFNWVALGITVGVFAVGAVTLYFVHGYQLRRTAAGLLTMIDALERDGEWHKAAEYLDRYLHLRPSDGEAKGRMAIDFAKYAKEAESWMPRRQAIDLHYRALAAGNAKLTKDLRLSLMDLLLDYKRFNEAEKEARHVLEKEPDNVAALRALAIALASQLADGSLANVDTKELKLVKNIEKARQLNPQDGRLARILAIVYREYPAVVQAEYPGSSERERHEKADESLNQLVTDNPSLAQAYLERSSYRTKYDLPDAGKDLEAALKLEPDNPEALLAAAVAAFDEAQRIQRSAGDEKARLAQLSLALERYEQLVALPQDLKIEQSYQGLGDVHFALGDVEKAIEVWRDGLKQFKQPTTLIGLHGRVAEAAIERDMLSVAGESIKSIDQILAKLGGSVNREAKLQLTRAQDLRRATLLFKQQNFAQAAPLLKQVVLTQVKGDRNVQASIRALMQLGMINSNNGEWLDAATAFDQASALEPLAPQPKLAAATAWLYAGRADLASERAEQALHHTSAPEAWLALAFAQVQQQAQLPPAQRSWLRLEKAISALDKSRGQLREGWRVDFLKAEYALAKARAAGDAAQGLDEATGILRATETTYGSEANFWAQICMVYQSLKLDQDAERSIGELRKAGASAADVALAEARLASLRGDFAKAQKTLTEALKQTSLNDQGRIQDQLVQVTLAARDVPQARALLLTRHKQQPENLGIVRRLAELDLEQRNLNGVREWEAKLQAGGPQGEQQARYFRAWRMFLSATDAKDPQLQEALREAEQIILVRPNWAEASTLKGMVEQRLGRKEQAVTSYERAVQLGERRVIVFEQLIALLDDLKRSAEVDRYLTRLESDVPLSQRLAEIAMHSQLRRDRPEQAIDIARLRVKQRPDDPLAQLWLGRLLMVTGKAQEAEEPVKHATDLAPGDARYWNALVDYYLRIKNKEAIQTTIERLGENKALESTQKSLLLARCYEIVGDREQAEKHYGLAAEASPADVALQLRIAQFYMQKNPQQAKTHLQAALKLEPTSAPAKQMLAIVHAALGEMTEAEELLSVVPENGVVAADDVRLSALLLLQRGGEANLGLAVGKIEALVGRSDLSAREQATDRLLLARLYEQQARLTRDTAVRGEQLKKAEHELVTVAQHSDAAPAHVGALIQFLIRQDRKHEATAWLDRLETNVQAMPSEDPAVLALVVQLELQHGTPERAEKWMTRLEKADTTSLRPLVLRTQLAVAQDPQSDLAAIVEPKIAALEKAAKTAEDRMQLVAAAGDLYFGHKRYANAETWYRKLLGLDAKRYPPLVKALQRQGNIKAALESCQTAIKVDETVQPYLLLSSVLIEGKPAAADFVAAEPLIKEGLKKFESDPRLLYGLGLVRVMQKRDADSIELFRKVVAASPRSIPALNNLAMLLADIPAERPEALKLIDQAIDFAGEDASLLDTKGAILLYSGRSAEAVSLLELATREPTADPRHHFHLSLAYRDQGRIEEAKSQLKTALDRELISQVLTNTDQRLLSELRSTLKL